MPLLARLAEKKSRLVAGLMSGTSLDGVDAALARIEGTGRGLQHELLAFRHAPYPEALRARLLENSAPETSSVRALSQLSVRLAGVYAEAVRGVVEEAGLTLVDLDLVGSHGQTVHHVPEAEDCAGAAVTSTLQIGDPSVLANLLGVPVVGDFRPADMALGGQGAPLVPYFDYVTFTDDDETRGLLNLGGIANLHVLPAGAAPGDVLAFDTGPANMVIDALAERFFDRPYDEGGALAAAGTPHTELLAELLEEDYFQQPPPKSTGRERFGAAYAAHVAERARHLANGAASEHDLMASITALTAYSVYQAYARFLRERHPLDVLIASGGGTRNATLMKQLRKVFAPIPVRTTADYGVDPDAKEALCFAVLAHEALNGQPTNLPSVTGAARATVLGKICLSA